MEAFKGALRFCHLSVITCTDFANLLRGAPRFCQIPIIKKRPYNTYRGVIKKYICGGGGGTQPWGGGTQILPAKFEKPPPPPVLFSEWSLSLTLDCHCGLYRDDDYNRLSMDTYWIGTDRCSDTSQ